MVFLGDPELVVSDFVVKTKIPGVTPTSIMICPRYVIIEVNINLQSIHWLHNFQDYFVEKLVVWKIHKENKVNQGCYLHKDI